MLRDFMKHLVIFLAFILSHSVNAELLDKILAVVDGKIITLSTVERVKKNLPARRNISPLIYDRENFTNKEIVEIMINSILIRAKLENMNYVISDSQVESQIKMTEKGLGLNRDSLLRFLSTNNLSFDEYFELTREAIEFNLFSSRFIAPLISVTDQEVKNYFYKKNQKNKRLSFKYTLVDFSLPKDKFKGSMVSNFPGVLQKFQTSGILPNEFSELSTNVLGDITEDGLTKELSDLLKRTDEGKFTAPLLLYKDYHVFFVKKKDLVESEIFSREKEKIKAMLMKDTGLQISTLWFEREKNKHYIKYFF